MNETIPKTSARNGNTNIVMGSVATRKKPSVCERTVNIMASTACLKTHFRFMSLTEQNVFPVCPHA